MDFRNFTNADPDEWEDYREIRQVKACHMEVPFFVNGISGVEYGNRGDWLVETKDGVRFIIKSKTFDKGERFQKA